MKSNKEQKREKILINVTELPLECQERIRDTINIMLFTKNIVTRKQESLNNLEITH